MPPNGKTKSKLKIHVKINPIIAVRGATLLISHISLLRITRTKPDIVFNAAIIMAGINESASGITHIRDNLPSNTTLLKEFHALEYEKLLKTSSDILWESAGHIIRKRQKYSFAIDATMDPYYGNKENQAIIGGQNKHSTNYFYGYITLAVTDKGRRLTLAALPVEKGVPQLTYIRTFCEEIKRRGCRIRVVCLDRGFYVAEIIAYLQENQIPFIIPAKNMSEEMEQNLSGRTSHRFPYTIMGKDLAISVQVFDIVKYRKGKGKKKGVVHHPYVFFLISPSKSFLELHYRHRFAIESTYRKRNTVRAKTSSKDPVIRYFYFIVAMLLRNVWIALQWEMFAKIQRGPKVVLKDVFKFKHLIAILIEVGSQQFPLKDISCLQGFSLG